MKTQKVCLLGRFAVGKTSLVDRYINNAFSEQYQTTVGVSIATKIIDDLKMIIWDIAGFEHDKHYLPYLRGSHGAIWVVDSTEPDSVEVIDEIIASAPQIEQVPAICLVNKMDLKNQYRLSHDHILRLEKRFGDLIYTSAKTGADVEMGFEKIKSVLQNQN
ncbi:Rab family GTPase [Marinicella sp. W31]|uniref:Rab family GTPase n=1 Tax=Marinicella sp. W31 TaxID=3023713 RepID=UPI00375670B6